MSRRSLWWVFALSLTTLTAIAVLMVVTRQPETSGDVRSIEQILGRSGSAAWPAPPATVAPPADPPAPEGSVIPIIRGSRLPAANAEPLPVSLRINAIGVEAPIRPAGVDGRTGEMEVPKNVQDVAWYVFGSVPGGAGSAVLAAHVDLAGFGPGVFFRLKDLEPGDLIDVGFDDGSWRRFRVEGRTIYQKDELPLDLVFADDGGPVLTLVTCGGGFSDSRGRYDSNVVVYATPAPPPSNLLLR